MATNFGVVPTPQPQQPEALDPKVKALASAILTHESGGNYQAKGKSGEYGAYQFMPGTWKAWAGKHIGDENAEMTVENQNKVAYNQIKEWKDKGYNPAQIAAAWNAGEGSVAGDAWKTKVGVNSMGVPYNTPKYVSSVSALYRKKAAELQLSTKEMEMTPGQQADIETAKKHGAFFQPKTEGASPVAEAAKTVANIPTSAFGMVKGALNLINPLQILKNIKETASGLKEFAKEEGGYGKALAKMNEAGLGAAYEVMTPEAIKGLIEAGKGYVAGDEAKIDEGLKKTQREITTDPVGSILPVLMGAKAVKGKAVDTAIEKTAQTVTEPIKTVFGKTGEITRKAGMATAEQLTTLPERTISGLINEPRLYTKEALRTANRETLGMEVEQALAEKKAGLGVTPESITTSLEKGMAKRKAEMPITPEILGKEIETALSKRTSSLAETGAEYNPIRARNAEIKVSKNWIDGVIKELTGVTIKRGKVQTSGAAKLRESTDIRALQYLYDLWKPSFKRGLITENEFLNFRSDLARLSKFEKEIGKSQPIESFAKSARYRFNKAYRSRIEGLENIDREFTAKTNDLKDLAKGLIDKKTGRLTDTGMARIIKLKKEKPNLVKQLETISPGITEKIAALQKEQMIGKGLFDSDGNLTDSALKKVLNAKPEARRALLSQLEEITPGITESIKIIQDFNKLGKGFIDENGNITDRGMSRIVNATREPNPLLLKRLEKISPGITKRINIYRAAKDIEAASGIQVGTYTKSILIGGGFVVNPLLGIVNAILLSPSTAVPILRSYGMLKNSAAVKAIVGTLKTTATSINKLPEKKEGAIRIGAFSRKD